MVALAIGERIVQNGVGLSDDSFLYIERAIKLWHDFELAELRPRWFPGGYGALLSQFLRLDAGPIGAASWLNSTLLLVLALASFKALYDLTGDPWPAFALALAAMFTTAVSWSFQWAWSEPAFIGILAVHLLSLVRYLGTRRVAWLALFTMSFAFLFWARYAGLSVIVPFVLFAGWDLWRRREYCLARLGLYVAGIGVFTIIPVWNLDRFTTRASAQPSVELLEILRSQVWNLLVAGIDAVGPALFVAFAGSGLILAGWFFRRAEALDLGGELELRLTVLAYTALSLATFSFVCVLQLIQVTRPGSPIDPFIELRFAAPCLPWILIGVGAAWGCVRHLKPGWHRVTSSMTACAVVVLLTTLLAGREAISAFLWPQGTYFSFQYGHAGEYRQASEQMTAFLEDAAEDGDPLIVVLLAPTKEGMPPKPYFQSLFYWPHRWGVQTSRRRFKILPNERGTKYRQRIIVDGNGNGAQPVTLHYYDSTSDHAPETLVTWLSTNAAGNADRFVLVSPKRPKLRTDLEAFVRMGYIPKASTVPDPSAIVWILFEKTGREPCCTPEDI